MVSVTLMVVFPSANGWTLNVAVFAVDDVNVTLTMVASTGIAVKVVADTSVAMKVCGGSAIVLNVSVTGVTDIVPLVTDTKTFCCPP